MMRLLLPSAIVLALIAGVAVAPASEAADRPVPTMPVFNAPPPGGPPPTTSTTQHGIDAAGNAVDTTQTYRSGPFGTYTDQTTTTTYPPGNPALGTTTTH